jgi:hypothetical protein
MTQAGDTPARASDVLFTHLDGALTAYGHESTPFTCEEADRVTPVKVVESKL